ncbi:TetR/AcrR family transcriptional regulator [Actinomadura macrotermitis]|nr:TetR/AcrR family transcriptional regulator [Actinomadura macrotermitis]
MEPPVSRKRPAFRRLPADRRRDQIIEAAVEVFGRRPEPEVSIDDVAAAAGTSRSSMYRYFEGKQELYGAAAQRVAAALVERLEQAGQGPRPVPPSVLMATRLALYLDFLEQYEAGYAGLLGRGGARAPEAALAAVRRVRAAAEEMTCRALQVSEPGAPLRTTVRSWVAGVEWAGAEWLRTRTPPRPVLERLLAAQFATMLVGAAALDAQAAGRVAWLLEVEPAGSPFGALVRSVAGTFDRPMVAQLARFLGHRDAPGSP